jgi:hypothetical protein
LVKELAKGVWSEAAMGAVSALATAAGLGLRLEAAKGAKSEAVLVYCWVWKLGEDLVNRKAKGLAVRSVQRLGAELVDVLELLWGVEMAGSVLAWEKGLVEVLALM